MTIYPAVKKSWHATPTKVRLLGPTISIAAKKVCRKLANAWNYKIVHGLPTDDISDQKDAARTWPNNHPGNDECPIFWGEAGQNAKNDLENEREEENWSSTKSVGQVAKDDGAQHNSHHE